jgi:hypothetical protein
LRGFFTPWEKAHASAAANADCDIDRFNQERFGGFSGVLDLNTKHDSMLFLACRKGVIDFGIGF